MLRTYLALLTLIALAGCTQTAPVSSPRQRILINSDWRFAKDDPADADEQLKYANLKDFMLGRRAGNPGADVSYVKPTFDDSSWRQLNLPHDWGIEGEFKQEHDGPTGRLPCWGVGWYRKHLYIPIEDLGKQIDLDIDGAMSNANVWLNGHYVGGWAYGYTSFRLNLTPFIKPGGQNVLAIHLENIPLSSRWYPGAGLYRNVWLTKTSSVHVGHNGTQITTTLSPSPAAATGGRGEGLLATVDVKVTVDNDSTSDARAIVRSEIFAIDANNKPVGPAVASTQSLQATITPWKSQTIASRATVNNPRLWSTREPNRYVAITTIEQNSQIVDSYKTPFGIRTLKFDPNNGFFMNGEHLAIHGVCEHHDFGALGAAWNYRAMQRKLEMLKEMGCNALRTSHNPPAPEVLDLCDKMGFVVMAEAFDQWMATKRENDYHTLFADWSEKDLRAFIQRDRNHPSVIIWSMGNEIREQDKPAGQEIAKQLATIVHEEDPTRPTTAAVHLIPSAYNGFQNTVDIFGFNYSPFEYAKFHRENPNKFLIGSETVSTISTRGEYQFPVSDDKKAGRMLPEHQMSSYDLYGPNWAMPPDVEFKAQDENPFVGGEFVWTGFDYLGEPTPWEGADAPSRSSYFGIFDLAGFKKDRYDLYKSVWRPDVPTAHILPHWNWPERLGQVTPVHVYTSGDEAELFLNGRSLGRRKKGQYEYRLRWDDVKYEPGELKVVAYKNGNHWADDIMKTTGPASQLVLSPDRNRIANDGLDLSYVSVTITDKDGLLVPRSKSLLKFEIEGPGEIVAVDNGDPTSLESFHVTQKNAFNGLCMVIVRGKPGRSGRIALRVISDRLTSAEATITSGR